MALRDYAAWHDEYDRPGSPLHLRLLVVQNRLLKMLGYETIRYLDDAPEYAGASSTAAVAS